MVNYTLLALIIITAIFVLYPYLKVYYEEKFSSIEKYGIKFVFRKPYLKSIFVKSNYDLSQIFLSKNLTRIYLLINNQSEYHNLTAIAFFEITNKLTTFYIKNNYTLTLSPRILNSYEEIKNFEIKENEIAVVVDVNNASTEIFYENGKVYIRAKNKDELDYAVIKFIIDSLKLL